MEQQSVSKLRLASMMPADLDAATTLSRGVGWPHRLEDWQFVLSIGEGFAGYIGDDLVATAMWWSFERRLTRVGMVIVNPKKQRAGVGRSIMLSVLDRLKPSTILLNATAEGEPLYRQLGFKDAGAIYQHQGTSFSAPLPMLRPGERIRPSGRSDVPTLIELDAAASGVRREKVISALAEHAEAVVLDADDQLVGFAFCRRFGRGYAIGPIVARDVQAAQALIGHWVGSKAGMFMRIDVPEASGLSGWLDGLGLVQTGRAKTLSMGSIPKRYGHLRAFALANQALG